MCQGLGPNKHEEIAEIDRRAKNTGEISLLYIYIYIYILFHFLGSRAGAPWRNGVEDKP